MIKKFPVIVGTILLFLVTVENIVACPACKDSFTKGSGNASVGDSYSWSILFMLTVPLTILTIAMIMIGKRVRQNPNSII
ncbi:MAG: hypothetical protein NTX15_00040 [Candidatus Kapabacteria bacterium]|nr:hypothetical protein [Candidatus Kapabacteria bacterium]